MKYASGWRWIRTTESVANRFTVCPLWPLGNPSRIPINLVEPTIGLEPTTSAVTGRRSNQLSHRAI